MFREKQGIDLRTGHSVKEIDRSSKKVKGTNSAGEPFEIAYDRLLIATGASPVKPDLPGFDAPGVMALKSLGDGRRIKGFIEKASVRKVIIIGTGYIALEMCEAMVLRGIRVEMVKPRPTLLPWMNGNLAEVIKEEIESHGVLIHPGKETQSITRDQDNLKVVCKYLVLEGQMVLVAVGVKPNREMADRAGLELGPGGSIAVALHQMTVEAFSPCDLAYAPPFSPVWDPMLTAANQLIKRM